MGRDDVVVERLPPQEAFKRVAHEVRFEILTTLAGADGTLAFGEIRDAVDVSDPGRLNYHLGKLTGRFVDRTDDGYHLATPGKRVVGAVLAGGYTKSVDARPVPLEGECAVCDRELAIRFEEHRVRVTCDFCGFDFTAPELSPGTLEGREREALPEAVDTYVRRNLHAGRHGYCPFCDGEIARQVVLAEDPSAPEWVDGGVFEAIVEHDCKRCGHRWPSTLPTAILLSPPVVAFHHRHGVDVEETYLWNLPWSDRVGIASVRERDPLRIEVPLTIDQETTVFVVDDRLKVVDQRRQTATGNETDG